MKRYTIGLITGILLTASAFMFMGAQNKNLEDITVKSITIKTNGKKTAYLGDGIMRTYNADGEESGYFGTNKNNDGMILLSDRYGDVGWSRDGKK